MSHSVTYPDEAAERQMTLAEHVHIVKQCLSKPILTIRSILDLFRQSILHPLSISIIHNL